MDRHEFARQYQATYGRLWLIAAGIVGDRSAADDIVQEAAVIAFRKRDSFESGTNFAAWAGTIVRHCAANYKRKTIGRNTRATDPSSLDQQPIDAHRHQFDSLGDRAELQEAFDDNMLRGLEQLTTEARTCLLLRVVDELPYAEIAELLGIPAGTAMSHVHRSKKQLRSAFKDDADREAVPNE